MNCNCQIDLENGRATDQVTKSLFRSGSFETRSFSVSARSGPAPAWDQRTISGSQGLFIPKFPCFSSLVHC
jgi:hypothetical protein